MLTKSWTREEFINEFGEFSNIKEALRALEKKVSDAGSVVCRVSVNGTLVESFEEEALSDFDFTKLNQISVDVDQKDQVEGDVRKSICGYIKRVKEASVDTAEKFRGENLKQAHENFSAVIDAMSCVWEVISDIRVMEVGRGVPKAREISWTQLETQFLELTQEISEAYQAEDLFLVSDLLEYELPNQLDIWLEQVQR